MRVLSSFSGRRGAWVRLVWVGLSLVAQAFSAGCTFYDPDAKYPLAATDDVRQILEYATKRQVLLWLSWIEMLGGGLLRVTKPVCANCIHVFHGRQEEDILFPGLPFTISFPGAKVVPRLIPRPQDEAILDDRLIGFPGIPGDTSPNP